MFERAGSVRTIGEYHRYSRRARRDWEVGRQDESITLRARTTVTTGCKRDSRAARDRYGATGTFGRGSGARRASFEFFLDTALHVSLR